MTKRLCPDCNGEMEVGFMPEFSYASVKQTCWHPGTPEGLTFFGMKGIDPNISYDPKQLIAITTYRCKECHVLRLYAD